MCGIIGSIGHKKVVNDVLIHGLKRLEYRGYDSAGLAVLTTDGLKIVKRKGKVTELEGDQATQKIDGNIGIAHTRWATHGEPNEVNSHPHTDCAGKIAVVHNGIIENFYALKMMLVKEGHKFKSETDTEVLAHLVEKFYKDDLEEAVTRSLKLVEGAFGIAVIREGEDRIVVARRGSPIILGVGHKKMYVASDAPAVLAHTKKVIYLNDNEIASLYEDSYTIKDLKGNKVVNDIHEIKWSLEEIEKGGFAHFMLKEMHEQPDAIANALRGRISGEKVKLTVKFKSKNIKRIVIVACGTSWHAGLIGRYILEKLTGIPVSVEYASEFRYRDPTVDSRTLVIAISQSGETADTLAAVLEAKRKGAKTLGIINTVGSTISREVDSGIFLHAGPEIGVASTKAFSCQVTTLILLAIHICQDLDKSVSPDIAQSLVKLPRLIREVIADRKKIQSISKKYQKCTDFLYLGRGINFPVALEGALKLKEISYIHAEGYPAGEMKHGPIAMIDPNLPSVFVIPDDDSYEKTLSNMQEIKARQGKIIAITSIEDEKLTKLADDVILVPNVPAEISPIINNIPLQFLAYYIATAKGINVDQPRNLAKSVTVE